MTDAAPLRAALRAADFRAVREELGWDVAAGSLTVEVAGRPVTLVRVAEKRGVVALVLAATGDAFPDRALRSKIQRQVRKTHHENLVVFHDPDTGRQIWQTAFADPGKPIRTPEQDFVPDLREQGLVERLLRIQVTLDQEDDVTLSHVTRSLRRAFNPEAERVTTKFYREFTKQRDAFEAFIDGLPAPADRRWYAAVMLNRLMFVYFLQRRRFLDDKPDYLETKLAEVQARYGEGHFHGFYRDFLRRLFHEGLGAPESDRDAELTRLIGKVPYLNGGIFEVHALERGNDALDIPDAAFAAILEFFGRWEWQLDDRPLRTDREINPDVLGHIFEKFVNQKEMGAYYTKEDITEYIGRSTIVPAVLDAARRGAARAFDPGGPVWGLLAEDPDRYVFPAVRIGTDVDLPPDIEAGRTDVARRTGWNRPAAEPYALPTETWREHVARRDRYEALWTDLVDGRVTEVDDLVTRNLDLRQLLVDAVDGSDDAGFVWAVWAALTGELRVNAPVGAAAPPGLSVLDPTCGSGAFLFAALTILQPVYEACLDRMRDFVRDADALGNRAAHPDFRAVDARVRTHPNETYFVLKSIILNNLFGVDIEEEAIEICKLRLFLKLVSQLTPGEKIEALPDVDFNIRAGNTLVGYADAASVERALNRTGTGQVHLDMGRERDEAYRAFTNRLADVRTGFDTFRRLQTEQGRDPADFRDQKARLSADLNGLRATLDQALAVEYAKPRTGPDFEEWQTSHRPFHWLAEFYGVMSSGGFDVIIGNPPYVELSTMRDYAVQGYTTTRAGNLYALVMERCSQIVDRGGRQGFIVPVSSISTERYEPLQSVLRKFPLWYSSYDDRPSRLFDGLEHIRLTIHIYGPSSKQPVHYSTQYRKWSKAERTTLFEIVAPTQVTSPLVAGTMPKLSSPIEMKIITKLRGSRATLGQFFTSARVSSDVYYSRKVGYFLQVLSFVPRVLDGQGRRRPPSEFKTIRLHDQAQAFAALGCLNSNLFYWFITVYSDCRHLNRREVETFPINLLALASGPVGNEIQGLASALMDDIEKNSQDRIMRFSHDTLTVQNIIPKHSKPIIDQIDGVLAEHYGFNDEELDFIVNYDIKFRMGRDAASDDEPAA